MRLIEQLRWWAAECDRTNFGCQARKLLLEAAEALEKAETVKHAQWENVIESVSVMSCTGFPLTTTAETCTGCLFRSCFVGPKALLHDGICPNCGAKMDGERVALEEVVDIDAQTQRNNAAMRRVIDFVMDGGNQ